jgi:nucleoside-triphosphatase THEP1
MQGLRQRALLPGLTRLPGAGGQGQAAMRSHGLIYVVTGERGAGKSTVCAQVAREAAGRGMIVAGVLTERCSPEPGAARRVVDLRSGQVRPFGVQSARGPSSGQSDPLTPSWEFDPEGFAWANEVFARATPCYLLIVDEVGPLELVGGRGWTAALAALNSHEFGAAVVVCRPGLLAQLETSLGAPPSRLFAVDAETRDDLPAMIMAALPLLDEGLQNN